MAVLVLALVACADAGTGAIPPTAEASAKPDPSSNPSPSGREVVLSSGRAVLRGTFMFDFERGGEAKPDAADVWWEQVDGTRRYLVPQNGARLARMGEFTFDAISRSTLLGLQYAPVKIDGSNVPSNGLAAGVVIAVVTRNQHLAKMRVEGYGYDLVISWVTYD